MSSTQVIPPEHISYVHCNFCNTILAVSITLLVSPGTACSTLSQSDAAIALICCLWICLCNIESQGNGMECGGLPSKCTMTSLLYTMPKDQVQRLPIRGKLSSFSKLIDLHK
ncbi:hypothetical protein B296_00015609 [Ensete ventricosum]|uniref:YABBY N-terminal domain-containing protein n=1 Tax=Ensete ventricosum TaxID=4639 RepID=A0A426ZW10_ENSVE|nr:hypothetical protein B296_00015609 [Ensete ventricosum]